jgi:hypothetical protein
VVIASIAVAFIAGTAMAQFVPATTVTAATAAGSHGYRAACCGDYRSPYGVGYGAGYGYPGYHGAYRNVGYRYGGYGFYPGYIRGYGYGCGGGDCGGGYAAAYRGCGGISVGYGWSGYRASYCGS